MNVIFRKSKRKQSREREREKSVRISVLSRGRRERYNLRTDEHDGQMRVKDKL